MEERIEQVFAYIRPALARHGGNIELAGVDLAEGIVRVRMTGSCKGCPFSQLTLKMGVERAIIDAIPEIKSVVAV
jgi:Fe-S cluster biogenesis protein NfuA